MEAPGGFEPPMEILQTSALPLGYAAVGHLTDSPLVWNPFIIGTKHPPRKAYRRDPGRPEAGRGNLERETGFEPATSTLARLHSTTELFPPAAASVGVESPEGHRRYSKPHENCQGYEGFSGRDRPR